MQIKDKDIIIPRRKKHSLVDWFMMKQDDVINEFMTLPGAETHGTDIDERFIWIPGTHPDRILLVAHIDTVFRDGDKENDITVGYYNGVFFSNNNKYGIGADDRAGVGMLWHLRNMGHSILLPAGEERGCDGSEFLMRGEGWPKLINSHKFAIELDRMNGKDLVYYNLGSPAFKGWCGKKFPKYRENQGSYTDIRELCTTMCGLNISIGYYSQHGPMEHLKIDEWNCTLDNLKRVLSEKEFPKFDRPPKQESGFANSKPYNPFYDHCDNYYDDYPTAYNTRSSRKIEKSIVSLLDGLITCPNCGLVQEQIDYKNNDGCNRCGNKF